MLQLFYITFEASSMDYWTIYKHDLHTSLLPLSATAGLVIPNMTHMIFQPIIAAALFPAFIVIFNSRTLRSNLLLSICRYLLITEFSSALWLLLFTWKLLELVST